MNCLRFQVVFDILSATPGVAQSLTLPGPEGAPDSSGRSLPGPCAAGRGGLSNRPPRPAAKPQNLNRKTIWPLRGLLYTVPLLIYPKPEIVWPVAETLGVAAALVEVGLFTSVRLNTLKNSARRFMLTFSAIRKFLERLNCSSGRRW